VGIRVRRRSSASRTICTSCASSRSHPNPGVKWDDLQKQLKRGCDLARKHGAKKRHGAGRRVATNTVGVLSTAEDWTRYGQIQQAMMDDPEMQAVMVEAGQIAIRGTYVSQTIRTCNR
jgi:hypothetical protein